MISRRALLLGLAASGASGASGCGRVPLGPPPKDPFAPTREVDRRERLAARIRPYVTDAGVAVIILGAPSAAIETFGRTGYHDPHLPRADSLFELGGLGEILLGMLLVDRVEAGRVKLDTPAARLLPEALRVDGTLQDLAVHAAGLPTLNADPSRHSPASEEAMAKALKGGAKADPSVLGIELLAHALATYEGRPYAPLLEERVLARLGMTTSGSFDRTLGFADRLVEGFDAQNRPVPAKYEPALFGAPYAIRASPNDVLRLTTAMAAGSRAACLEPRRELPDESALSLGWRVERGRAAWWQEGRTTGFSNACLLEKGRALAVLTASGSVDALALARELARELALPSGTLPPRAPVAVPPNVVRAQADYGGVRLIGWKLDHQAVKRGGDVGVTLYWQCTARTPRDWLVRVRDDLVQADHYPPVPTYDWRVGEIVPDSFLVHVPRAFAKPRVALNIELASGPGSLKAQVPVMPTIEVV